MFALALLVGIYSYLIFIIGILGTLDKQSIVLVSLLFIFGAVYYFYTHKEDLPQINIKNKINKSLFLLFLVLAIINFIGALAPEYSFDAVWYHLTFPKIFLQEGMIFTIPNGIFSYSAMPKLGEMLFTPFVAFNLEVFAKLIQWGFGILTSIVIYKISRRYFDETKSFFAVLVFYGSLIVAWESTVAYVDLIRAFFEIMALWGVLIWFDKKDQKVLIESAIFAGLAISTKLLAFGTLPIFAIVLFIFEKNKKSALKNIAIFFVASLVAVFPWLLVSLMTTGNPVYPILSNVYPQYPVSDLFNIKSLLFDHIKVFTNADILISPIYIIFLPLALFFYKKFNKEQKIISVFVFLALIVWYFIPRTGGGRFMVPYLPAASILCIVVIENIKSINVKKYSYALILFVLLITIFYRGLANVRYLPVIVGVETKDEFLSKNLNFEFGDFYDVDGYFKRNITSEDKVLLVGFHNIFYVNFPFVHESYIKPEDKFNYIATQDAELPIRYSNWKLVYENKMTNVKVYSLGGKTWAY